jgi:uncharacterized integral membrane protein
VSARPPRRPELDGLLDAALTQAFQPPRLPDDFRARLRAALARERPSTAAEDVYARLQREQAMALRELEANYLRLRRRTLLTLLGLAFATGALATVALPWLMAHWGPAAFLVLPALGAIVGLALAAHALGWWRLRDLRL